MTHDAAPYEIVGGVPARHIGWRYGRRSSPPWSASGWWDWDHGTLAARVRDFDDVEAFCARYDPRP